MILKAHKLRDHKLEGWHEQIAGRWHYRDLVADENWRNGWISFDALYYNADDGLLYCGLNSIDGDLLYSFDPTAESFQSLHTRKWTDRFDVKIHRNLLYSPQDKCLYFATSLLHDVDSQPESPGGKIVRYDTQSGEYEVLGIPIPKLYIQSMAADFGRGLLYGFTYPAEALFVFDLATRQSEILAYTGNSLFLSQPHNPVVDADGWLWGTYSETRAWDETLSAWPIRLFKYHPEGRRFVWFDTGLSRKSDLRQLLPDPPKPEGVEAALEQTRHTTDYGFADSMAFDGTHYIYVGTVAGVLCRIDTRTDQVEKIAHVMSTGRFPALTFAPDGTLCGAGGMNGHTQIMRWRPGNDRIESYPDLRDPVLDEAPERIHEIAVDEDGTLYLAENDNHHRSSYLWTARLDT